MMKKLLLAMSVALFLMAPLAARAQAPAAQPPLPGTGGIMRHVPLTLQKAKAAVDIGLYLSSLKADFPEPQPGMDFSTVITALKASSAARQAMPRLKAAGFADIEDWLKHFFSLMMTVSYVEKGGGDLKQTLADIEASKEMPEQQKTFMINMLRSMIPPEQNIAVVKRLLADKQMRARITKLRDSE